MIDKEYVRELAIEAYRIHDANEIGQCQLCTYSARHPCDLFELAEAILILLGYE
jgi:hypothetical protein